MAITERYVSSLAGGGGDGSSGTPWTLAEAASNAVAGDRVNVKADGSYSITSNVTFGSGTVASPIILRGYKTTIGDGNQGRSSTGPLDTTNMPDLAISGGSGKLTVGNYIVLESLDIAKTGTLNDEAVEVGSTCQVVNCDISTSYDNTGSFGLTVAGSFTAVFDCDISHTSSSGGTALVISNGTVRVNSCRLSSDAEGVVFAGGSSISILGCVVTGDASTYGIWGNSGDHSSITVDRCTGYLPNCAFLRLANSATPDDMPCVTNCHVTDSSYFCNNLYSGTSSVPAFRAYNRTRDNANADAGFGDWPVYGAVTTDAGDDTTDYTDASGGDFTLISTAAGKGAGWFPYLDIGAYQREQAASSGDVIVLCGE